MKRSRLKTVLMLYFTIATVVPLLISGVLSIYLYSSNLEGEIARRNSLLSSSWPAR